MADHWIENHKRDPGGDKPRPVDIGLAQPLNSNKSKRDSS